MGGGKDDDAKSDGYIKIGPVGKSNGDEWDEKGCTNIVQIFISHDDNIKSIQFQYSQKDPPYTLPNLSQIHGATDGNNFDAVRLSHPLEYIKTVSGHKSHRERDLCSITFGTNRGEYGPFGRFSDEDEEFRLSLGEGRQFGGFHGTADRNGVRSIGVYLKPVAVLPDFVDDVTDATQDWEILH